MDMQYMFTLFCQKINKCFHRYREIVSTGYGTMRWPEAHGKPVTVSGCEVDFALQVFR